MKDKIKDTAYNVAIFTISYAFNLHKLILIYTTVFKQWLEWEAIN